MIHYYIYTRSFKLFSCCYFSKGSGVAIISANDTFNNKFHKLTSSEQVCVTGCKKGAAGQELKKGLGKKEVKSKWVAKACVNSAMIK